MNLVEIVKAYETLRSHGYDVDSLVLADSYSRDKGHGIHFEGQKSDGVNDLEGNTRNQFEFLANLAK